MDYAEVAAEWVRRNPEANWGGTATVPPPEFVQAYEHLKLKRQVQSLEDRVRELEANG